MASLKSLFVNLILTILVLFVIKPINGLDFNDVLSPLLSPVLDDICKNIECGKGSCKASSDSAFFFECLCEPGWKQTVSNHTDHLKFLPCVIPNCTMDYSCTKAPPPTQDKAVKPDQTIFDPCYWGHCGAGSCNQTSKFSYNCECSAGFNNLLNISSFPCFQSCELGMDCMNLGISNANGTSSSTPALNDHSDSSILRRSLQSIFVTVFVVMILLKLN